MSNPRKEKRNNQLKLFLFIIAIMCAPAVLDNFFHRPQLNKEDFSEFKIKEVSIYELGHHTNWQNYKYTEYEKR